MADQAIGAHGIFKFWVTAMGACYSVIVEVYNNFQALLFAIVVPPTSSPIYARNSYFQLTVGTDSSFLAWTQFWTFKVQRRLPNSRWFMSYSNTLHIQMLPLGGKWFDILPKMNILMYIWRINLMAR